MPTNLEAIHRGNEKRVDQLDRDGNYLKTYRSIRIAGRECGINENSIACVCRGLHTFAGGFKWRYSAVSENEDEGAI